MGRIGVNYTVQRHSVACVWPVICPLWWSYECDVLYIQSLHERYICCYWLFFLEYFVSVPMFFADGCHTQHISSDPTRKCLVERGLVIWKVSPPVHSDRVLSWFADDESKEDRKSSFSRNQRIPDVAGAYRLSKPPRRYSEFKHVSPFILSS